MAQDSKRKRKERKLRREKNLTLRMLDHVIRERNESRAAADYMVKLYEKEHPEVAEKPVSGLTIRKIEEGEIIAEDNPVEARGQVADGDGLEVPQG